MAQLLVSVRSAKEACKALAGGASIIDVKEPAKGPLGRSSVEVWREVVGVIGKQTPISAALGELHEWEGGPMTVPPDAFDGLTYRKVGLAGAGPDWMSRWLALDARLPAPRSGWIAVIYTDWELADAPSPRQILDADLGFAGVLFDTWDKSRPAEWCDELYEAAEAVHEEGLILAVAGGLTPARIEATAPLFPDVIAVRGAACVGGERMRDLDQHRVAELAEIVRKLPAWRPDQPTSKRTP